MHVYRNMILLDHSSWVYHFFGQCTILFLIHQCTYSILLWTHTFEIPLAKDFFFLNVLENINEKYPFTFYKIKTDQFRSVNNHLRTISIVGKWRRWVEHEPCQWFFVTCWLKVAGGDHCRRLWCASDIIAALNVCIPFNSIIPSNLIYLSSCSYAYLKKKI